MSAGRDWALGAGRPRRGGGGTVAGKGAGLDLGPRRGPAASGTLPGPAAAPADLGVQPLPVHAGVSCPTPKPKGGRSGLSGQREAAPFPSARGPPSVQSVLRPWEARPPGWSAVERRPNRDVSPRLVSSPQCTPGSHNTLVPQLIPSM